MSNPESLGDIDKITMIMVMFMSGITLGPVLKPILDQIAQIDYYQLPVCYGPISASGFYI